jgi:hypothetical protein
MKSRIAKKLGWSRITFFVIVPFSLLHPLDARGAGCDQNVPIAPAAVQMGSGVVNPNPFVLRFTADQAVWVKITNSTVHLTQANIVISDGPGATTYCETSMGIVPQGSVVLHTAAFGDPRTEFKVVVTTGDQDVAQLSVIVYARAAGCKNGTYREISPNLTWNLTFSGNSLKGQRTDGRCSFSVTRQGQTWSGPSGCTTGSPEHIVLRANPTCTVFTSNVPTFRLTRQ